MKFIIFTLIFFLFSATSCKKEEEPTCTTAFTNNTYDTNDTFKLLGDWEMVGHYSENCSESLISVILPLKILNINGDLFRVDSNNNYSPIDFTGDQIRFTDSSGSTLNPEANVWYEIWHLDEQGLVIGKSDGTFIQYRKL